MAEAGVGADPPPVPEPRDHDARYALRAELSERRTQRLAEVAERYHSFKKQLMTKNQHMRENLKLLHMLSEHAEVDSELLAWLVRECQRAPENSVSASYRQEVSALGKERHKKELKDAKDAISRALNSAQVDVQQRKLDELVLRGPTPAHDPVLAKIVEIIASDHVVKNVTNWAIVLDDKYKIMYETICKKHKKPFPNPEQRRAVRLLQYGQVKEEFSDEDNNGIPITTRMIWAWFRGERQQRVDGRAFWNAYAVLCGYVDAKGDPLPPNLDENGDKLPPGQQLFHCDHILCRKGHRTSTSDGSHEPSYEVDHWSNYAIHWAAINKDDAMWHDVPDVISDLKKWIHGLDACHAIEQSVAHRAQRLAANRKHTKELLDKLGRSQDAQKGIYAWVPSNKYDVLVGRVHLPIGSRKRVRTASGYDELVAKTQEAKRQREIKEAQAAGSDNSDTPDTEGVGEASSSDEKAPAKVPGNAEGPMLKPDGSVPAADELWTDADGKKWRACASGQSCAAKHGHMHVWINSGHRFCTSCAPRSHGKLKRGPCPASALLPGEHKSGGKNRITAKYKGVEWTGFCCNATCANAIAKALYQHEHEGVPYPEGFRPPSPTSSQSAAAKEK